MHYSIVRVVKEEMKGAKKTHRWRKGINNNEREYISHHENTPRPHVPGIKLLVCPFLSIFAIPRACWIPVVFPMCSKVWIIHSFMAGSELAQSPATNKGHSRRTTAVNVTSPETKWYGTLAQISSFICLIVSIESNTICWHSDVPCRPQRRRAIDLIISCNMIRVWR